MTKVCKDSGILHTHYDFATTPIFKSIPWEKQKTGSFFMHSVNQNLTSLLFANNRMIFVITGQDMKMYILI